MKGLKALRTGCGAAGDRDELRPRIGTSRRPGPNWPVLWRRTAPHPDHQTPTTRSARPTNLHSQSGINGIMNLLAYFRPYGLKLSTFCHIKNIFTDDDSSKSQFKRNVQHPYPP